MKKFIYGWLSLPVMLFVTMQVRAQQQSAYVLPAAYTFDYEVVQQTSGTDKTPQNIIFHYPAGSDYMAISPEKEKGKEIIFTKTGEMVLVDEQKKTIMIMRLGAMIKGLANSMMDKGTKGGADSNSIKGKSVKTGNKKQICGYPAEEYRFTDSKGEVSNAWFAKVDFNASMFYMAGLGTMGGGSHGMPGGMSGGDKNFPSLNDPHQMLAELTSSKNEKLTTQSITKKPFRIETKGYTVNNMSSMGLDDLMKMKAGQN